MHFRLALIDIETTGLHVTQDKIIEIAVIILTEKGIERTWSSLIKPEQTIPEMICNMTGITNALVATAPRFRDIADELQVLVHGSVLVAHNARFDYGFLKNAFKACELSFQIPVLCTIKLFKALYPLLDKYNLGALAARFSIPVAAAHRAEGDVNTLHALLNKAFADFSLERVFLIAKSIYKTPSIPATLKTTIDSLPDSPGVYLFYGAHSDLPLYIGKSIHVRQRVFSHFQADFTHPKEFTLAQQVERIEVIPTAGELSALLLESALIKEKMPLYNRRLRRKKRVVGFKINRLLGYSQISMVREVIEEDANPPELIGAFSSLTAAKRHLLALCKTHELCPKRCGLESGKGACFSYQLKQCKGACVGDESPESYNARVSEALAQLREDVWPYSGAIAIKEQDETNQLSHYLVFNQWRKIGVADDEDSLLRVANQAMPSSEFDTYKILRSFLKTKSLQTELIELASLR